MKLFKNKTFLYILTFVVCGIIAFVLYEFFIEPKDKNLDESNSLVDDSIINRGSSLDIIGDDRTVKVLFGSIEYDMILEDNQSVNDLLGLGSITISMTSKDDQELYGYFNNSMSYNPTYTGKLYKGDVLLSDSNCITIMFKDVDTDLSYVKLGHIDNLGNLDYWDIDVTITFY